MKKQKKAKKKTTQPLWGGRFAEKMHRAVEQFSKSVHFDQRLYFDDIRGSIAHATMLHKVGLITAGERNSIIRGLQDIMREIVKGRFAWSDVLEDVHMNIEAALTTRVPAGAKLHTGRSRNDQVVTDMRLWFRNRSSDLKDLRLLQKVLVDLAEKNVDVIMPGYTHLQRAQPVYFAHHMLAYVEMFERDAERLSQALQRADVCPLGSGALAGSSLPLNREFVARQLGFHNITQNSMDAVSDRDFLVEYASIAALIAVHLSRLAEDLILWSSAEFGFVEIGDAFTTGSSLMPQKKNPDVAELVRGKTGRVIGNLVSLLTTMKGLPMTYNRDLQEDKEPVFDTADTITASLRVMTLMFQDIKVNKTRCEAAAADPLLMATDLVDALVRQGIPFRRAHTTVGKAIALAKRRDILISELPLKDWKLIEPKVNREVLDIFHVRKALERRKMTGAPNSKQIYRQLNRWKKLLKNIPNNNSK